MNGQLFTQDFLLAGITQTPLWKELADERLDAFIRGLKDALKPYNAGSRPNEATTEQEIISKVLGHLGWQDLTLPQVSASGGRREDVPDQLFFPNTAAKSAALKEKKDARRYRHGIALLEAKRWFRALDRGDATDRLDPGTPSNQILRYLSAAEIASERAIRWGILTNGAVWRLYYQGARSRSEDFLEIDVAAAAGVKGAQSLLLPKEIDARHVLKVFFCFFQQPAFLRQPWDNDGRTFHHYALAEARHYEERVSEDLGTRVFATVFRDLADALASGDTNTQRPYERAYLEQVREAALILLYRLLFVLYAEDRELLPLRDPRYAGYSLRRIRDQIRDQRDNNFVFSTTASRLWDELNTLFRAIANGDKSLGLPAYNGGLFEDARAPLLARVRVPDSRLAPAIDELSRRSDVLRAWINYRDLSVQHLGSIYERLLEYRLEEENGRLVARPTSFARRGSGSYYTHDDLVKLLIEEAVGPLIGERMAAFEARVSSLGRKKEIVPHDLRDLENLDPASRMLDLKVCDPAMGSGHFLVALVDELADRILESMSHAADLVAGQRWSEKLEHPWASPVVSRIADLRKRILAASREHGWAVDPAQLDDRHVVRRMILKRVIHGVDKNPMAVELAKVALWLHTFTVGAPLSFLDHHLRCGDALFGGRVSDIKRELGDLAGGLLQQDDLREVSIARDTMQAIGELTDIDIAEAHKSKAMMDKIEAGLKPLARALDFLQAKRWALAAEAQAYSETWADLLNHEYGENLLESIELLSKRGIRLHGERQKRAHAIVQSALRRAGEVYFLHWELAFPTVWQADGTGGFDAIIGNPPWDRMKLQEVEWFAERRPEIAKAVRASDRKRLIRQLESSGDPLWQEYLSAKELAEIATDVARKSGDFPLLSSGDINLYSLFVERASTLINDKGMVGLLTPSGIAADKGAAEFFQSISESGRLSSLFDFENKKVFFPDIHASFKFCTLVFAGTRKSFENARCAFYLHSLEEINEERVLLLGPKDFSSVNPNTGSAPIFRCKRDAAITTAVYSRQPVLVDRRPERTKSAPIKVWPVRYVRMFDMTNDSKLFKKRDELERDGWYPAGGSRWKKGDLEAVPLYEGKMVQLYDHRAADIVVNTNNLKRPAQQEATTAAAHFDPEFSPTPQFWVSSSDIADDQRVEYMFGFKHVTAPTNVRTMIAAIVPACGAGNSLPLFLPDPGISNKRYASTISLMLANFNSFAFDFVLRQKVQGQNLNLFMIEQIPMIRPEQYEGKLRKHKIADFVREQVLNLSYTARDLTPFARDLGYEGNPIQWDEEDRRHRMARLDALYFHLYGISRDDVGYVLDTFPIVREEDERVHGRFLTKELVLAYLNAVAAGDLETKIVL
jgi:hypothetical protein